jgi:hypothetical protein
MTPNKHEIHSAIQELKPMIDDLIEAVTRGDSSSPDFKDSPQKETREEKRIEPQVRRELPIPRREEGELAKVRKPHTFDRKPVQSERREETIIERGQVKERGSEKGVDSKEKPLEKEAVKESRAPERKEAPPRKDLNPFTLFPMRSGGGAAPKQEDAPGETQKAPTSAPYSGASSLSSNSSKSKKTPRKSFWKADDDEEEDLAEDKPKK